MSICNIKRKKIKNLRYSLNNKCILADYLPKKYIGCFEDDSSKTKGASLSFHMGTNNSPRRCMNLCNTHQIKYASVKG